MTLPAVWYPTLKEKPHVTEREAKAIWLEAKEPHVRMLIKVLWFTGLRISEAISLERKDLKKEGGAYSLMVARKKQEQRGKGKNQKQKSRGKSQPPKQDTLPIPKELGVELDDYIKSHNIRGRLFPAHRSTYWRQLQKCASRAGIQSPVFPHAFRHGFVYHKASQSVHPYVLSRLAGHKHLKTTMEYYQPTEDDLREAMER